ncbi:MAG TPA: hypothetical protein VF178_01365 [Gemmatimonadaceae bacterium]
MSSDRYLGTWHLIPELSLYAAGTPPQSGTYSITEASGGTLTLRVVWRMPGDASEHATEFGGRADAVPIPIPHEPGMPDAFTLTRIDAGTLDSAALRDGEQVAYARRAVTEDGSLMAVVQEYLTPNGQRVRNFQVYRRGA